ncbi:RHS repeat-associated core domain-containing protein [Streptomyces sp. NPDC093991]|uniref:RHS repeat domain-containing protein n=1 Tax=unclassified Streptomyces TaxID=2593676 RepID=UPI003443EC1C
MTTPTKPHTLDKTTGDRTANYTYDSSGNTTSRPGPTAQQNLAWDAEGELSKVTEGSTQTGYLYDANGELLIRRTSGDGDTILYFGNTEVRLTVKGTTKTVSGTRYYTANGQTIAVRTAVSGTSGTKLSFLAPDHHGTSNLAIEAGTFTPTKRYTTPFGAPRGPQQYGPWPDDKGFLGKPRDTNTGLTHIEARAYDPITAQFISVDPLLELDKHQTLNGYSYAVQNPLTHSDPTGMGLACGGAGGASEACPTNPGGGSKGQPSIVRGADIGTSGGGTGGGGGTANAGGGGANLAPATGTPKYKGSADDAYKLNPSIIAYGISYAQKYGVDENLVIALLMQEQPFYTAWLNIASALAKNSISILGKFTMALGGKDPSVGPVQMKAPTARAVLVSAGYGEFKNTPHDVIRQALSVNEEFAVSVAVLKLKVDISAEASNKQAYLGYALSEDQASRLADKEDPLVQTSAILSRRSARYDANMAYLSRSGKSMSELFGLSSLPVPQYGDPGGFCTNAARNCG